MRNQLRKNSKVSSELCLICPSCGELLLPGDLEMFKFCPFCNYEFRVDEQLEDFVINPVAVQWTKLNQ